LVDLVIIGLGQRGLDTYGQIIKENPHLARVTAVADPRQERREKARQMFGLSDEQIFNSADELLAKPQLATAAIITTQDRDHYKPTVTALKKGYHVLLEKPMSNDPMECLDIADTADQYGRILTICHVLRYTSVLQKLKEIVDSGRIGRLVSVQWTENVPFWHQSHSYVRGNWRNSDLSSPMILAKSCHDVDAISWLVGKKPTRVSSFGSLVHFRPECAPEGATKRCTDGCPVEHECPYSAIKIYLGHYTGWPVSVISEDHSLEGRLKALQEGPWGRCVYYCDNNVVDHQVVNIEFEDGTTAAFTMCGFSFDSGRTIKLMGTLGQVRAHSDKFEIEVTDHLTGTRETMKFTARGGHGGGDPGLMRSFIRLIKTGKLDINLTSAQVSAESHMIAFAAEESRVSGEVVDMGKFITHIRQKGK
jgi:predicted dehydrogenase